jgi:hypothetical protein
MFRWRDVSTRVLVYGLVATLAVLLLSLALRDTVGRQTAFGIAIVGIWGLVATIVWWVALREWLERWQ